MRTVANIFLILFLNAAIIGIADMLLADKSAFAWLPPLYDFVGDLLILFAFLLYIGFAVNRHLPKTVLVPPMIFLGWGLIDFWPLEKCSEHYLAYVLIAQLLLGVLVLQRNLQLNKKSRLLVRSQFAGPSMSTGTMFRFMLLNLPLSPLILLLLLFSSLNEIVDQQGAGFMCLKPNGLYMVEKVYRQGEKQIHLTGMIHLGQQSYFESLSTSLSGKQALLLAEGVSDELGRLKNDFSYQKIAELLGLTSQERMLIDGRLIAAESLDDPDDRQSEKTDVLPADIDLAEFDERTITLLNALGHYLLGNDSLLEGFREFNQWARQNTTPETNQVVMNDLVQKRNRQVLSYLPKALNKYDTIIIPWGALHMPGLEAAIIGKGFHLQEEHKRLSIDFLLLPYEKLWSKSKTRPNQALTFRFGHSPKISC